MRLALLSAIAVAASLALASLAGCGRPEPTLEERAQKLDRQLICPVCPGESLEQSNVQIAKDMRELIRERLAAGESESSIRAYFVERYGTRVLAEPPASGVSLAAWIIPPVVLGAGAGALYLVVREMRRKRGATGVPGPAPDPNVGAAGSEAGETGHALEPYLEAVDDELRRGPG